MSDSLHVSAENGRVVMRASGASFVFTPEQARLWARDMAGMAAAADAQISAAREQKLEAARKAFDKAKADLDALEGAA